MKSPKRGKNMKVHTHKKQSKTLIGCYTPKVLECLESLCEQSSVLPGRRLPGVFLWVLEQERHFCKISSFPRHGLEGDEHRLADVA